MTPHPPDEYWFSQITRLKRDVSLLQTQVESLAKSPRGQQQQIDKLRIDLDHLQTLAQSVVQLEAVVQEIKCRNSLPWWRRLAGG